MEESPASPPKPITPRQLRQIEQLAQGLRYGSITLVFQDGVLIQLDRNEKIRVSRKPNE